MTAFHGETWQIALVCLGLAAFLYLGIALTVDPDRFLERFAPNSGTLATELGRLFIRIAGMLISGIAGLLLYAIASSAW